jgi:hypothetical protein
MRLFKTWIFCGVLVTGAVWSATARGEAIAFDRPESWAMKHYASTSLMTGPPVSLGFGQLFVGVEADWLPELSELQRTVGFNGTKTEDLNKVPALGRLRLSFGLPWQLSLNLAWLPPIPINGLQANLLAFSLGKTIDISSFVLQFSAYGQVGAATGDFTCSARDIEAENNPFGCTRPSKDSLRTDYAGLSALAGYRLPFGLTPYLGAYVTYMNLGFSVNANYAGATDMTVETTQGGTFAATGGLMMPIGSRVNLSAEAFYSPLTVSRPQVPGESVDGLFNVRGQLGVKLF